MSLLPNLTPTHRAVIPLRPSRPIVLRCAPSTFPNPTFLAPGVVLQRAIDE